MSTLQDFLIENQIGDVKDEIIVSPRLKGRPFSIRAMTGDEFNSYQKAATKVHKGKRVDFDNARFQEMVIINHTTEPNFRDAEFIKRAGCATPGQLLNKVLLAGEMAELSSKITELSGFDVELDEMVEEAKNS